jgi:hypothetical protein
MATVNLDTAARLDIVCRKGDSFELILDFGTTLSDTDEANWKMQISESDTAAPEATVEGSLSSGTGFTIGNNSDGEVNALLTINISSTTMAGLTSGLYVYDIQSDSNNDDTTGGTVKTHLYGTFKVNEDITNPSVA